MNYTEKGWEEYCNYLSEKDSKNKTLLETATDNGFLQWKVDNLWRKLKENTIKLLKDSIYDIENHLTKEEFKDYCDSIETSIAYWKQVKGDFRF